MRLDQQIHTLWLKGYSLGMIAAFLEVPTHDVREVLSRSPYRDRPSIMLEERQRCLDRLKAEHQNRDSLPRWTFVAIDGRDVPNWQTQTAWTSGPLRSPGRLFISRG